MQPKNSKTVNVLPVLHRQKHSSTFTPEMGQFTGRCFSFKLLLILISWIWNFWTFALNVHCRFIYLLLQQLIKDFQLRLEALKFTCQMHSCYSFKWMRFQQRQEVLYLPVQRQYSRESTLVSVTTLSTLCPALCYGEEEAATLLSWASWPGPQECRVTGLWTQTFWLHVLLLKTLIIMRANRCTVVFFMSLMLLLPLYKYFVV